MKKTLAFVLSLLLLLGSAPAAVFAGSEADSDGVTAGNVPRLSDVAGTKYETAVTALIEDHVVDGYPDGTFKPNHTIKRSEAAKLFVAAKKLIVKEPAASKFTDMNGHWAAPYVEAAADDGIINGYGDGTFGPERSITYNEAAKIMVAALGYTAADLKGTWPDNYRNKADAFGITMGMPGKTAGGAAATRGDFVLMLYRTLYTELTEQEETHANANDPKIYGTDPISLSLDEAIELITTSGTGYETAVLNKQTNENAVKMQTETLKTLRDYNGGNLPKTYDAKALERYRQYLTEIAPIQYQAELNTLESNAVNAYFNVINMENTLQIAKENLEAKKTILVDAQKKYQVGAVSRSDLNTAESNVKSAEQSVEQAESGLAALRMAFNMTFGFSTMRDVTLTNKLEKMEAPEMNLLKDIEAGQTGQMMIQQLKFALQEAEWDLASVKVKYPKNSATYRSSEISLLEAERNLENALNGIEMTIRSNYRAITNGETAIASAETALDLARESYRMATVSYNAGMATMSDLQQAQLYVNSCETDLASAISTYNLAIYEYKYATGVGKMNSASR